MALPVDSCHDRPSTRLISLASAGSKLRFGFASLAWSCPRYAISDGGLTAIGAIGAIGAIDAIDAMDAIDAIGAIGGGWGCPWGCFKKNSR